MLKLFMFQIPELIYSIPGYSCLSAEQQEVVVNFVAGQDVFVSGAGKSLCYLVLPSIFNLLRNSKSSIVIVVCLLDGRPGST